MSTSATASATARIDDRQPRVGLAREVREVPRPARRRRPRCRWPSRTPPPSALRSSPSVARRLASRAACRGTTTIWPALPPRSRFTANEARARSACGRALDGGEHEVARVEQPRRLALELLEVLRSRAGRRGTWRRRPRACRGRRRAARSVPCPLASPVCSSPAPVVSWPRPASSAAAPSSSARSPVVSWPPPVDSCAMPPARSALPLRSFAIPPCSSVEPAYSWPRPTTARPPARRRRPRCRRRRRASARTPASADCTPPAAARGRGQRVERRAVARVAPCPRVIDRSAASAASTWPVTDCCGARARRSPWRSRSPTSAASCLEHRQALRGPARRPGRGRPRASRSRPAPAAEPFLSARGAGQRVAEPGRRSSRRRRAPGRGRRAACPAPEPGAARSRPAACRRPRRRCRARPAAAPAPAPAWPSPLLEPPEVLLAALEQLGGAPSAPSGSALRSLLCGHERARADDRVDARIVARAGAGRSRISGSSAGAVIGCFVRDDDEVVGRRPARAHDLADPLEAHWRACEEAGSMLTSGGPVSRSVTGSASATSSGGRDRAGGDGVAGDPAAAADDPVPARARGSAARGRRTRRCGVPSSVSTAGITTTAAPVASAEQSSTPMPIEVRIGVGAIAVASDQRDDQRGAGEEDGAPGGRDGGRGGERGALRRVAPARAPPPWKRSTISSENPTPSARPVIDASATAIGSVSTTWPSSAIAPKPTSVVTAPKAESTKAATGVRSPISRSTKRTATAISSVCRVVAIASSLDRPVERRLAGDAGA